MITIFVPFQFVASHRWKDAPDEYNWLRHYHQHTFICKVEIGVTHEERDVSFEELDRFIESHIIPVFAKSVMDKSCETIAADIRGMLQTNYGMTSGKAIDIKPRYIAVSVTEDGIRGAKVD